MSISRIKTNAVVILTACATGAAVAVAVVAGKDALDRGMGDDLLFRSSRTKKGPYPEETPRGPSKRNK